MSSVSEHATVQAARAIGDAVLYEGYLLYPYRASSSKNQMRWQWGVLMPPAFVELDPSEHAGARTECLCEPRSARADATVHFTLRYLQAQARTVAEHGPDGTREVDSLVAGGYEYLSWTEAVEREAEARIPLAELLAQPVEVPFATGGEQSAEPIPGGEVRRGTQPVSGVLRAVAESLTGPFGGVRLRVEVANTTGHPGFADARDRDAALHHALVAAHVVLRIDPGHFLSMLDPPEWARPAVEACEQERMWPVLIGDGQRSEVLLCSPIILYDDPAIAEESSGPLFDGTEIDEILTLRTMALTDEEKHEARRTDDRAAEIIDRVDGLPGEMLERMHGTVRYLRGISGESGEASITDAASITDPPETPWWDPGADASVSPETDAVIVAGVPVAAGARVQLRPGLRGADAQDMFLSGRSATVRAVVSDVEDETYIAVTLDDDPAADLQHSHGRYLYFSPEEITPLPEGSDA